MNKSDDASVSDDKVPPEGGLEEGTDSKGSSDSQEKETPDAPAEKDSDKEAGKKEDASSEDKSKKDDGGLDPSDPDYWQKKYQRDETSWKKRHSDLMSARQVAERERDELKGTHQKPSTPVSKKEESSDGSAVPERFETTKDLANFIEKKASEIAEKQVQTYLTNQDKAKAEQAGKEAYNKRWETVIKADPALDVNELAQWMQKENVFDPVHALAIRNRDKEIEDAERRGAEKVLKKLKENKSAATEGSSKTAPVAPKKVPRADRASYLKEILETGERDSSH